MSGQFLSGLSQRCSDQMLTGTEHPQPTEANVAQAIRAAVAALGSLITANAARIEVAVSPAIRVRLAPERLVRLIEDMVGGTIRAEPGVPLLLTAEQHGEHVDILLTDDCQDTDVALRTSQYRDLAERVALLGGRFEVTAYPGQGCTLTLRLLAPSGAKPSETPVKGAAGPMTGPMVTSPQLL